MARIPLVDPGDANLDPAASGILEALTGSALGIPNVLRAMANHPVALREGAMVAYRPGCSRSPTSSTPT